MRQEPHKTHTHLALIRLTIDFKSGMDTQIMKILSSWSQI